VAIGGIDSAGIDVPAGATVTGLLEETGGEDTGFVVVTGGT
jgi:sulfur carrier protein ThiS